MFDITRKEIDWAGRKLVLETGKIARQADGAVVATYGGTIVLCTVVAQKTIKPGIDFFPLTVHYQEKTFAAGKIPGGFFKREGRPSEKEILTSRLIDRPIRPLFPDEFRNETQVVCTLLSHDGENDPDIVAMVGASAALTISGIPFLGPIGAARVAHIDGKFVVNPTLAQMEETRLDLVVAGTESSVLMVESEAKELSEAEMLEAVVLGHKSMQPVIEAIISFAEQCAKEPWELAEIENLKTIYDRAAELTEQQLRTAYGIKNKQERVKAISEAKTATKKALVEEGFVESTISEALKKLEMNIVRTDLIENHNRIDGRAIDTIRPIQAEVGVLPRTHGSSLFTRGETQALVVATLGTSEDEQIIDALEGEYRQHFMLHYNFPPYSVGEATPLRAPGRREIGHGKLAWRAIHAVMPEKNDFPYTIRLVSEITESNGSSSMATVCGSSLALMDAGVPLKAPVAGIAMGLVMEGDKFVVLSDIMGDEDHLGDMDFKVAGTDNGITALQMDIKINGITPQIMQIALEQAHKGRKHILKEMSKALTSAREELNEHAPRITSLSIPKDKIREVIGTGGKVIREIVETTGAKIDIEDDGTVRVFATNEAQGKAAVDWIKSIVTEVELGQIYTGKVVRVVDFGAFVNLPGGKDGLVHISELCDQRVATVTDVVNEGDVVKAKVLEIDGRGKIRLSMRVVNQETGEDLSDQMEMKPRRQKSPAA
jgi:polyribonucleotide nucleotidyltransferase